MRDEKGFTLIELIIVLLIISLITAAFLPFLARAKESMDLRTASSKLAADLRYVQQRCISGDTGGKAALILERAENRYIIKTSDENEIVELPSNIEIKYITIDEGDNSKVTFSKFGRPSKGGTVVLHNSFNRHYSIVVAPATGIIRVFPGEHEE